MNKLCHICLIVLDKNNCYSSDWKRGGYICKICRKNKRKNIDKLKIKTYTINSGLKLKEETHNAYGNKCECCGETIWQFLTIDHVGNWGNSHRKIIGKSGGKNINQWLKNNNYPKDLFRLLCMNCNSCIGFHGFCPHKIKKSNNCMDCDIQLNKNNQYEFHIIDEVSLCKLCVINRSTIRKTAKNEILNGQTLQNRRKTQKKITLDLRKKIIEGFGSKCVCCGEDDYMFLTIDHINDDGYSERKLFNNNMYSFYQSLIKNNFPIGNYQLLCYNCNCCRGAFGKCYHELCRYENRDGITISEYKDIILRRQ